MRSFNRRGSMSQVVERRTNGKNRTYSMPEVCSVLTIDNVGESDICCDTDLMGIWNK